MQFNKASLIDILNSAESIIHYITNKSKSDFYENEIIQDAVIRRIEIIGEASNRISEDIKTRFSDLPWKKMKAMRNILIHMYDELDLEIVCETIAKDIPFLIKKIKEIIPLIDE